AGPIRRRIETHPPTIAITERSAGRRRLGRLHYRLRPPVSGVPRPVRLLPGRRPEEPDGLQGLDAGRGRLVLRRTEGELGPLRVLPADEHLLGLSSVWR